MIPKKINYIWLSGEKIPKNIRMCIKSWEKQAKGYEIRKWTLEDFNLDQMPVWVKEAVENRRWAFACDYLRLYVLYHEGGIYLDSDVLMLKSPNKFMEYGFATSVEYFPELFEEGRKYVDEDGSSVADEVLGMAVQAAIMFSEPGHPLIAKCMEFYENNRFVLEDGSFNEKIIAPHIFARAARTMGFKHRDELQLLPENTIFFPSCIFAPAYWQSTKDSVMIHMCAASWREMTEKERKSIEKLKRRQIKEALSR